MPSKIGSEGDQYRERLKKLATSGNKVTSAEADSLIREAEQGRLTEVEGHYLAGFVDQHRDAFDDGAKKKLVDFITSNRASELARLEPEKGRARPVAKPATTPDSDKSHVVHWAPRPGSVSVDGFKPDDPMQGNVGDCYFISSMVVVAKARPDLLEKAITDNGDGTYTVRFHARPVRGEPTVPVEVTIDGELPQRRKQPEYASARDPKELWPLLFEKAYASWKGSYDAIEAGMAANALEALTGADPSFFFVSTSSNHEEVFKKLDLANQPGGCVVALSKPEQTGLEEGLVPDHAYAVLGTQRRANGELWVKLRNPWGEQEPGHDRRDDGIFWLPMGKFLEGFSTVETVKISP